MKLFRIVLIVAALSVLTTLSQAQRRAVPHWIEVLTNYVTNPGFENGYTAWDRSQSYHETDEITYINLGMINSDAHSGSHGMDMQVGEGGYNGYFHSDLNQTLATPIAVSSLSYGSIWCQSSGNYLNMVVTYTDNTQTFADFYIDSLEAAPGNNGFVQWNFLPLLNQSKTIKAIDFNADSFEGSDVTMDDISLSGWTWVFVL